MKVKRFEIVWNQTLAPLQPWSWHSIAGNGKKLGWSGEHYNKFSECADAFKAVTGAFERGYMPVYVTDAAGVRKRWDGEPIIMTATLGWAPKGKTSKPLTVSVATNWAADAKRTGQRKRAGTKVAKKSPMRKMQVGGVETRTVARRK
jgi:hypothetical protein